MMNVKPIHLNLTFLLIACGIIIVSLAATTKGAPFGEGPCTAQMGACGNPGDCDKRCKYMVTDGNGKCDAHGNCNCEYLCVQVPPKLAQERICRSSNGYCDAGCGENCCKEKCKTVWHPSSVDGSCLQVPRGSQPLCLCTFDCPVA